MQYVRNLSDSVSTAWNSINPATLSGAIDVIVVERADGTLACSPFHVRFGKFSLLRPYEKKVEFKVNGKKQDYAMKLGEGGEAFFVFETSDTIPQSLQTSPLVSPVSSPPLEPGLDRAASMPPGLQEPPLLELDAEPGKQRSTSFTRPPPGPIYSSSAPREPGMLLPVSTSPELSAGRPLSGGDWSFFRPHSDDILRKTARKIHVDPDLSDADSPGSDRSHSPPPLSTREALERAMNLSRELQAVNIPTKVTETGDLMLDMTGFKNNEEDALRAEIQARKVLSGELEGDYDIGALFGMDDQGNLWIYSSEEAKDAAMKRTMDSAAGLRSQTFDADAVSDPGYHSDDSSGDSAAALTGHRRSESDVGQSGGLQTPLSSPGSSKAGDGSGPSINYAKTLRLTSDQLKGLNLKPGENSLSFTVNRSTCSAFMYLWKHDTPVVISDIDGTITKSDALGHVLNMIGRDWTHAGVAKLYSDIVANGYNIMYLTSRSVGQADTTRAYLAGIVQDGYRLPKGPTILSPDRTMAALRREIYLRKPHVFKMATLRDIRQLYGPDHHAFYAGFGNRLTDQISYRTVDVPRTRIFTINSNAEVSLDLLSLNKLKLSYVSMTDVVDHYFPPVSTIIKGGGEEYTDFTYWRDQPLDLDDFSASESESGDRPTRRLGERASQYAEDEEEEDDDDEEDDEEEGDGLADSYLSRGSYDDRYGEGSVLSGDYEGEEEAGMMGSMMEALGEEAAGEAVDEDADDEDEEEEEAEEEVDDSDGSERKEEQQQDQGLAPPKLDIPPRTPSPKFAVSDRSAEMITGMKNLSIEKEVEQ